MEQVTRFLDLIAVAPWLGVLILCLTILAVGWSFEITYRFAVLLPILLTRRRDGVSSDLQRRIRNRQEKLFDRFHSKS